MRTQTEFILECIDKGFAVRKEKRTGFIVATKKNNEGATIKFELTDFDFNFMDGGKKEQKVQVFENGNTNRNLMFRMSTFEIHD